MDILSRWIADIILFIGQQTSIFWQNVLFLDFSWQQIAIDIALVWIIFYFIFSLLKGSRAVHVLIGLSMVGVLFILSQALQLVALGWLLDRFLTIALIAIPVIFQQELRMGLERLGHTKLFTHEKTAEINKMVLNIVEACTILAKERKGALIVIQSEVPLKEYSDTGIPLNAKVSKELLLSIFNPLAPLHDGAVIIEGDTILAASCILPHSFKNSVPLMGTRHKAALGLSESTDANIVVVSEEKGFISLCHNGDMLKDITSEHLHTLLIERLKPHKKKKAKKFPKPLKAPKRTHD